MTGNAPKIIAGIDVGKVQRDGVGDPAEGESGVAASR